MGGIKFVKTLATRVRANGPGLTVAVIALIFALVGGAFAASGALTAKQKKEVTKIAKKYAGKNGESGAAGANGKNGANGKDGTNGTNGAPGKDGESVTISAATIAECSEGGTKFTNAAGTGKACNGKEGEPGEPGPEGEEGKPWTAGGTLPQGATETGYWTVSGSGEVLVPLSYSIPLIGNVSGEKAFYGTGEEPEVEVEPGVMEPTEFKKHCPTTAGNPKVAPGEERTLCVYVFAVQSVPATFISITRNKEPEGTGLVGGVLRLNITTPGIVYGTFAVSGG